MRHQLKTREMFFKVAWAGRKPFEIRKDDRKFEINDEIVLQEWDGSGYTGREIEGFIDYITDYAQQLGYIVFSYHESRRTE